MLIVACCISYCRNELLWNAVDHGYDWIRYVKWWKGVLCCDVVENLRRGLGIVEIPRMLWIRSQPRKRLRMLEFAAGMLGLCFSVMAVDWCCVVVVHGTMLDAKADLEQDLREFYRCVRALLRFLMIMDVVLW